MSYPVVTDLLLYPIKGCRGYTVDRVKVTSMGLLGDREFTVTKNGERANQKQVASLMHLSAIWSSSNHLELNFPGCESYELDCALNSNLESSQIKVYGNDWPILDMGDEVAQWLTHALGDDVRLIKTNGAAPWFLPVPEFNGVHGKLQTKFVDAAPLLLTSGDSLVDLNSRLEKALPMNRFRPNIVIEGLEAYREDELQVFQFGSVELDRVAVCERCIVTTTDQETGEMAKEPLRTLSKYRKRADGYAGGIMFGIYLTANADGEISIGESMEC